MWKTSFYTHRKKQIKQELYVLVFIFTADGKTKDNELY